MNLSAVLQVIKVINLSIAGAAIIVWVIALAGNSHLLTSAYFFTVLALVGVIVINFLKKENLRNKAAADLLGKMPHMTEQEYRDAEAEKAAEAEVEPVTNFKDHKFNIQSDDLPLLKLIISDHPVNSDLSYSHYAYDKSTASVSLSIDMNDVGAEALVDEVGQLILLRKKEAAAREAKVLADFRSKVNPGYLSQN
jgi:hypothetical protein